MPSLEAENDSRNVLAPDAGKGLSLDVDSLKLHEAVAPAAVPPIRIETDGDLMHALALKSPTTFEAEWPFTQPVSKVSFDYDAQAHL